MKAIGEALHIFVIDDYLQSAHRSLLDTPARKWLKHVEMFPPRMPPSQASLNIALGREEQKQVHHYGVELTPLLDEDYVILSTMHSAKGQEWRSVFILKAADGCIPSDLGAGSREELEEERRLLYVAMTRAKDSLELTIPQRFYIHQQVGQGDRHVYGSRTRFIPAGLLDAFEERSWAPARTSSIAGTVDGRRIDLSARMKEMWR